PHPENFMGKFNLLIANWRPIIKYISACRFVGFLTSNYGQSLINSYKKNNVTLFHADFGRCNYETSCMTTEDEIAIWTPFQAEFAGLTI
ncbi:MAG: hypothetical protein ACFFFB_27275, partial [Candidatus Heimdallarchaeota archaeon]